MNDLFTPAYDQWRRRALIAGAAALALCLIGAFVNPAQFFRAYLIGFLFWFGIGLGCLAILMLQNLAGGAWGLVIERVLEAGSRTLPLLAVLFLPLLFGLSSLYLWANPQAVAASHLLQHKAPYLNPPFFMARALFLFAIWTALAILMSRWSAEHDRTGDPLFLEKMRRLSGPGLLIYVATLTVAAIDWVMSMQPMWYSTGFGLIFVTAQGLATMAFVLIVLTFLSKRAPLSDFVHDQHFIDLGNLLLMFVMLWSYISFAQFLIIWSGNIPEEVIWYMPRTSGGWTLVAIALIVFHFAVPFVLLLMRTVKRRAARIRRLAIFLLVMRWVDTVWLVEPPFHPLGFSLSWMDIAAPVGIGGIWLWYFLGQLAARPVLPLRVPAGAGVLTPAEET